MPKHLSVWQDGRRQEGQDGLDADGTSTEILFKYKYRLMQHPFFTPCPLTPAAAGDSLPSEQQHGVAFCVGQSCGLYRQCTDGA